jgi:hypothetical protein
MCPSAKNQFNTRMAGQVNMLLLYKNMQNPVTTEV